ncbi:unnamed protein product [Peronospora farinosa]|uniref:Uncharacterized protein n=1 Tax=Peronospora farinosa TaxID=134698 RepID=A0ABN8CEV5_9STRA|nr:unnamed protein product [Peronospora farinosa]
MAVRASAKQVQQQLIKNWSTLHYRIEYGGYLSNHLLHGVVALFDLGASEEKIEHFAVNYSTMLEKKETNYEDVTQSDGLAKVLQESKLTFASAHELLGKRQNFDGLLALYATEVHDLGIDGAVKKHLPFLVGGLAGALLHSIIQLGYSYHIGGERLVAEGLTNFTKKKTLSRGEALQLVHSLNGNEFLLGEMRRKLQTEPLIDLKIGKLQKRLSTMSGDPERGSSTAFLLIWKTINRYDLSKMDGVFALDLALWLYMMIEHNDFVILHAVTSAWALQQVEHLLAPKDRERAWKVWLHVALSAFVTNDIKDVRSSDVCEHHMLESKPWEQTIPKTLSLAELERDLVHAYKLVQVAHNHAKCVENAFLTSEERDLLTRQSALKVITCDFGPL